MLEGMISHKEERRERIDLRERLLMWRAATGLSQEELGKRVGMGQPYISFMEVGRRTPTIRTIENLSDAMDITIQQFLFGDPKHPDIPTYDDGYAQALQDIRNFLLYKSQELEKMIHGRCKDRKILLGLTSKVLLDPEAMDNFKKYGYKAKYRVYDDGTIAEIL